MLNRRQFLAAAAATLAVPSVRAHHGWSSFDLARPLYLRGTVAKVMWVNPHAEFDLAVAPDLALPADLPGRQVPAQSAPVDGKDLLAKAALPTRKDRVWRIELAPLSRMEAWKVERLQTGETVELVGFGFPDAKPGAILRVEYLFRAGKAYALRSSPA